MIGLLVSGLIKYKDQWCSWWPLLKTHFPGKFCTWHLLINFSFHSANICLQRLCFPERKIQLWTLHKHKILVGLDQYRYMHIDGCNCYAIGITLLLVHQWRKRISFSISSELYRKYICIFYSSIMVQSWMKISFVFQHLFVVTLKFQPEDCQDFC